MEKAKIVNVVGQSCPACSGGSFKYHPQKERQVYKDKVIVGKYECMGCGWQSGLDGEV